MQTREEKNAVRKEWRKNPEVRAREAEYTRNRYHQDPLSRERSRLYTRQHRKDNPLIWLAIRFKARAKALGLPFDEDMSDVFMPDICPILGIPIECGEGKCTPNSPSFDRIIPSLGYVKGNRWIISMRANVMKSDASLEEIVLLGKWAEERLKRNYNA